MVILTNRFELARTNNLGSVLGDKAANPRIYRAASSILLLGNARCRDLALLLAKKINALAVQPLKCAPQDLRV